MDQASSYPGAEHQLSRRDPMSPEDAVGESVPKRLSVARSSDARSKRFEALDGLRGIAAICVMLVHNGAMALYNANLAVDLFFLLSGFVIAHRYRDDLLKDMSVSCFLWRRFIRLYPMILAGAVVGYVAYRFFRPFDRGVGLPIESPFALFLRALLLLPVWRPSSDDLTLFPVDTPLWSLFFEVVVNVGYCYVVRWLSLAAIACIVAVSLCLVPLLGFPGGWATTTMFAGFPRTTAGFFGGVLLFELWKRGWLPPWRLHFLGLGVLTLAVFLFPTHVGAGLYLPSMLLLSGIVLLGINSRLGRTETTICVALGSLSYPLYLLHRPLLCLLTASLQPIRPLAHLAKAHVTLFALITAIPIIAISYGVLIVFDEPIRHTLARLRIDDSRSFPMIRAERASSTMRQP